MLKTSLFLFNFNSMRSTAVSFQHLVQNQNQQKILRDGSSVLVRVLADKGGGKYEVSLAGMRLNISARNPLKVGQSFVANVNAGDSQIQLKPQNVELAAKNLNMLVEIADSKVLSFLASVGLPADDISYNIMQQFKQLNMKMNVPLMKRIHQLSKRFEGKEKIASQTMINLVSKGMDADDAEIEKLMSFLEDEHDFRTLKADVFENGVMSLAQIQEAVNEYFRTVFDDSSDKKIDILSINNHFPGWIYLPFSICRNEYIEGEGCIKLLVEDKMLKKLAVSCGYSGKNYNFCMDFAGNICRQLKVNVSPFAEEDIESEVSKIRRKFMLLGKNVSVEWCDKAELEGTACGSEKIVMFGGEV